MAVISGIRNIRGEMEVPPSKQIAVILSCGSEESLRLMKHNEGAIISLARVSDLAIGQGSTSRMTPRSRWPATSRSTFR